MGVKDELAVTALARALVRTGMYVDAGHLDNPRAYAEAILNDPDLAADGLHFVVVETLDRIAALAADAGKGLDRE